MLAALEGYDGRLVSSGWGRFWSEHSERTTLPSGLAVLGVEKSDRDARFGRRRVATLRGEAIRGLEQWTVRRIWLSKQ